MKIPFIKLKYVDIFSFLPYKTDEKATDSQINIIICESVANLITHSKPNKIRLLIILTSG